MRTDIEPREGLDFLVAGLGMMGSITPHIIEQAGGRITGILGVDEEEVDTFLENNRLSDLQFTGTFEDYDEALKDKDVEAVAIAVPNYMHVDMGIKAAKQGKHILIEKPLATSVEDAVSFSNTVYDVNNLGSTSIAVEINSQYRHHEILGVLRDMIDQGEVREVEMGYLQGWQANPTDAIGWRPEVAVAGRGKLVGDLGAHVLQTTLSLFGGNFSSFYGKTYNVHPKRFKPKKATVSFDDAERPGPREAPDDWVEMDMLDSKKYSGDDRAEAVFALETRKGRKIHGKYILSQVDPGNENNFYIRVHFKDGREVRWFQEDPNHLDIIERDGGIHVRQERGSAPSMTGRPGGHPHGYGDAILLEVDKMMSVVETGDNKKIKAYSQENMGQAVEAVRRIDQWLQTPLQPYNKELDGWLSEAKDLRSA